MQNIIGIFNLPKKFFFLIQTLFKLLMHTYHLMFCIKLNIGFPHLNLRN